MQISETDRHIALLILLPDPSMTSLAGGIHAHRLWGRA